MTEIQQIRDILEETERIVFFGGAGVSTESGVPDFRGSAGLYTHEDEDQEDPQTVLTPGYLRQNPALFYEYYRANLLHPYAQPNDAHEALARLEQQGKLLALVTQNIDGLHQAAGSENVLELHGSVHRNYCVRCGKTYSLDAVMDCDGIPQCEKCGGLVRPDVVLYGESVDAEAFSAAEEAVYDADVLIVGGTSLTVHPASSLVELYEGEHLIIINETPTPYDGEAEFVIRAPIAQLLRQLVD